MGTTMGLIKGDTRSLDYSSHESMQAELRGPFKEKSRGGALFGVSMLVWGSIWVVVKIMAPFWGPLN